MVLRPTFINLPSLEAMGNYTNKIKPGRPMVSNSLFLAAVSRTSMPAAGVKVQSRVQIG